MLHGRYELDRITRVCQKDLYTQTLRPLIT